jgi:hypothetical protein
MLITAMTEKVLREAIMANMEIDGSVDVDGAVHDFLFEYDCVLDVREPRANSTSWADAGIFLVFMFGVLGAFSIIAFLATRSPL